jgi:hypothetical protein
VRPVKYIAKLEDGTIFEKKGFEGDPYEFVIDAGIATGILLFSNSFTFLLAQGHYSFLSVSS